MTMRPLLAGLLGLALCLSPLMTGNAHAQGRRTPSTSGPVTDDGYAERAYGKTFYLEVPMVDTRRMVLPFGTDEAERNLGIGGNITAESIINNVRFAGGHADIHHVVFLMRTGGGAMFHADAMLDVIEEHHDATEFHIIVDEAISGGIWTVFSCDNIFMVDGGTIGGATAYRDLGGVYLESASVPQIAARLAFTAERNGHAGAILPAMLHLPAELHYWEENGEQVLSGQPPASRGSIRNYQELDTDSKVLTLTSSQAVDIGLAQRLRAFDATLVGDHIGTPGWTRANRYGHVVQEIGEVYNVTRQEQDRFEALLAQVPFFRDTRENRELPVTDNQIVRSIEDRAIFQTLVDAYTKINLALNNLPAVHPERHIYFVDGDGRTILEDPEQWAQDLRACQEHTRNLVRGFGELRVAYRKAEVDADNLNDIDEAIQLIVERINGISRQGNAAYWLDNPVEYGTE